jgi:predicted HTH transcriptional regulator
LRYSRNVTLEELLSKVETQCVEFKRSLSLQREGLEALDGMINAEPARGVVIFGVAPDRRVVGVEQGDLDQAQRSLVQHIGARFDPPIQVVIELAEVEGKALLVVSATRHRGVPYHEYDGRAFIREGTACRQLSLQEKQYLQRSRDRDLHPGPWKCDRCGSVAGLLISMAITDRGVSRTYKCGCGGEFWPAV